MTWSRDAADEDARLFVGGLDTSLVEVDPRRMAVAHRRDSYGGAVWCLAACPERDVLAVGCEDGGVKLFSTADGGLEFQRALPSVQARLLSLAWQPGAQGLFAGAVDGTIRHLDAATGHSAYRMTLESRNSLRPTMVWCLRVLPDGTLVSGDSLGSVQFWDGATGTLQQSVALHSADVLALEATAQGDTVFSSGVDSKLVCLRRAQAHGGQGGQGGQGAAGGSNGKWAVAASNRAHSHDVTALAIVAKPPQGGGGGRALPLLVSGGKDTKVCTYSVGNFAHHRPRYVAPYPYSPIATLAMYHPSRLLLLQHDTKLHLWRLGQDQEETGRLLRHSPKPALELKTADKGRAQGNIVCSALAPDGRHLAYATGEDTRVFAVEEAAEEEDALGLGLKLGTPPRLLLHRVRRGLAGHAGVTALGFDPDGRRLVAGTRAGRLLKMELDVEGAVAEGPLAFVEAGPRESGGGGDGPICLLAVSGNGKYLAVARLGGEVEVYRTKDLRYEWTLQRLDSAPTALSWHLEADVLAVACVSNRFYLFDNAQRRLATWSQDFGHRLPRALLDRQDCVLGVQFSPGLPNSVIVHGFGFLCYVDMDRPMTRDVVILPEAHPAARAQQEAARQRKRKREAIERQVLKSEAAAVAAAAATAAAGAEEDNNGREEAKDFRRSSSRQQQQQQQRQRRARAESTASEGEEGKEPSESGGDAPAQAPAADGRRRRLPLKEEERAWSIKMHLGYQGILAVLPAGVDELLLVEEPWLKIVSKLPEVLHRQRFGT